MEILKHECGIAMVRLLKPLQYYKERYGTWHYGLDKLYLLMEKERNRGQDGAGMVCVKSDASLGEEYMLRERALGQDAVDELYRNALSVTEESERWEGNMYMGHLRYSTTGKHGLQYLHPFVRRDNYRNKTLALCGNFNMTNAREIFDFIASRGQFPRSYADTYVLLEQIGHELDKEVERSYEKALSTGKKGIELSFEVENYIDMSNVLSQCAPRWDGGFVICGATGSGEMFSIRDPHGIRPAFYYIDDEVVVVASERPVIQTVMNVRVCKVKELQPGEAIFVNRNNQVTVKQMLAPAEKLHKCAFERIYFSRGTDRDIYQERKHLGYNLAPMVMEACGWDIEHTVMSFIPNTAESAFYGMMEGVNEMLNKKKSEQIAAMLADPATDVRDVKGIQARVNEILNTKIRAEKVAIKDVKFRTFITEDATRNDIAPHVYDITYGLVEDWTDNVVVIDDSVVRGTTLKNSIVKILERLYPKKLFIVSSSPQVRYPDFYGIDMCNLHDFIAFKAAVALLEERGMMNVLDEVYKQCKEMADKPKEMCKENYVKAIYAPFTDVEVSNKISEMVSRDASVPVECIFQTLEGLHEACPGYEGDWYFSGNYPTQGGLKMLYQSFVNYYESR